MLLLAGVAQLLERHSILDQFPGEPRDLRISELECGLDLP
jgi:hypothetical protein